ncbi:MAG: zinc-binding dehydrogenase [Chloroflexi bacterium]|nr:zinc-binding dehydrogenase [Chloroflexota bacterium]
MPGGSGVGTAAIQLAKIIGARVFVTAGAPGKLHRCRDLGAALAVNYKEEDFVTPFTKPPRVEAWISF